MNISFRKVFNSFFFRCLTLGEGPTMFERPSKTHTGVWRGEVWCGPDKSCWKVPL